MHDKNCEFSFEHKMEQPSKKLRLNLENDEIAYVNAEDCLCFYFDDSTEVVRPEFVHQNFGQAGKIAWPARFMPLKVSVTVDTKNDLLTSVSIEHGGDFSSPEAVYLRDDLIATIANPGDVSEGCKPASYPGDLADKYSSANDSRVLPSSIDDLPDGYIVQRYSASDFAPKSFDAWKRAEWLMLWFIESVSQSQHETDPNWEYYILRDPKGYICAFSSVYRFPSFSYIKEGVIGERIRLSQFLTIPSRWNSGIGSRLLSFIVSRVMTSQYIDKLTMEDPSLGMASLRESVYLHYSNGLGLANPKITVTTDGISKHLKIPTIFGKRLKNLFEINKLRDSREVDEGMIDRIASSGNKFVKKFIDSIEFYDDEEEPEGVDNTTGDAPPPREMSLEQKNSIIHDRLAEALQKVERILTFDA